MRFLLMRLRRKPLPNCLLELLEVRVFEGFSEFVVFFLGALDDSHPCTLKQKL